MKIGKLDFDNTLRSPSGLNTQRESEFSKCRHSLHQRHALHILPERVALRAGINDQFALRFQVFAAFVEAAGGSGGGGAAFASECRGVDQAPRSSSSSRRKSRFIMILGSRMKLRVI